MGLLTNLLHPKLESRDLNTVLTAIGWGNRAASGVQVTEENSLGLPAVWACVRLLSESVASLPLFVYRRLPDGGKEKATNHPVYRLLHDMPNDEQTSMDYRQLLMQHLLTWGNAFSQMDTRGTYPKNLTLLHPSTIEGVEYIEGNRLAYKYREDGQQIRLIPASDMIHIRGMSRDGRFGWSPIKMEMESVGLGMAEREFGARFYSNGANMGGVLSHPGELSDGAQKRLVAQFRGEVGGLSNAHKMKVLEEGMTYTRMSIPQNEAQFIESRKFSVVEIARIFNVPPHMIQDLERATFSNIEHQSIGFVINSLRPHLVRLEQWFNQRLFTEAERRVYFVEHLVDGLLRGDVKSRYEAYGAAIQAGFMVRNEARRFENWNPIDGLDKPLVPMNMIEAGQPLPEPRSFEDGWISADDVRQAETRATVASGRRRLANTQFDLMLDTLARIVRREVNDIERAVKKYIVNGNDERGFLLWLSEFYDGHAEFIEAQAAATFRALGLLVLADVARELDDPELSTTGKAAVQEFMGVYVSTMAVRWILGNRGQLEAIVRDGATAEDTLAELLADRLTGWGETEAKKIAMKESVQSVNAAAKASYRAGGITRLRWVASGETCPFCQALDGKIVGIEENFVEKGEFNPEGAEAPLKVRRSIGHPPIHQGCDCSIVAA